MTFALSLVHLVHNDVCPRIGLGALRGGVCMHTFLVLPRLQVRQFRTAPAVGSQAVSFALIGDVGQTIHSLHTLSHVYAMR
jgi:hypothetical protein